MRQNLKNIAILLVTLHLAVTCSSNTTQTSAIDNTGIVNQTLNVIYNIFSSRERIIVFDPAKTKVEIVLDAKSLLFPTDPANASENESNDENHGKENNHDKNSSTNSPELKNQAKDTALKCRDKTVKRNGNHENNSHEDGFSYPFYGQCAIVIDKLALNIQSIDLVMALDEDDSEDNHESDDSDHKKHDDQARFQAVANIYNNTNPAVLHINSDGILAATKLIDPVTFNAVKFTFADGNQLVYKNGITRTTKPVKIKHLDKPAISNAIKLVAANVTKVHMALDQAKLTFGKNENELKGVLRYRSVNSYEGAYAYVQNYANSAV
ncbi:MAG: hypothetical protein OEV78_11690 [Spirochaetia bacterium]|nr:hypothetical protein [Spirochaetia bacterium]